MSYTGPATLLDDHGNEASVHVSVRIQASQGRMDWSAQGTAELPGWDLNNGVRLRLPDGREGKVVVNNVVVGSGQPVRISMLGNGEPPA